MRRDRSVNNPLATCVSLRVWRNVADRVDTAGRVSAEPPGRAIRTLDDATSGLLAQDRGSTRGTGAEVADRRKRQKAEAADRRIEHQRHPGRNRERQGAANGHQANHSGHQNQTCEHVLQPPREEQGQGASGEWQDCGREWEFLRRINLAPAPFAPGKGRTDRCTCAGKGLGMQEQSSTPEVTDDCLSFVTPRQQGAVARGEDVQ